MKIAEPQKASSPTTQNRSQPFFSKNGGSNFFGGSPKETSSFFKSPSVYHVNRKGVIQTKLSIGQPNDKYEKEADSMADKVVQRLTQPEVVSKKDQSIPPKPVSSLFTPFVQKKCAHCEEEEKLEKEKKQKGKERIQKKRIFESNAEPPEDALSEGKGQAEAIQRKCAECEKEEKLQKKSNEESQTASSTIESNLNSSKGSGSLLPAVTREQMESSFGADFSNVRIHNDSSSVQMSKDLSAQAFTHGNHIYFNSGKYDTNSKSGNHLLAHELTHVVQQNRNNYSIQRKPFGNNIHFDSLPGLSPKAQFSGPFNDTAISQELYGNPSHVINHESDFSVVSIDINALLPQWKPYFDQQHQLDAGLNETQTAMAALFALSKVLMTNASDSVGTLRELYNNGITEIIAQRETMIRQVLPLVQAEQVIADLGNNLEKGVMVEILKQHLISAQAESIAETLATMRHDLAINVRKTGGALLEKGAELIDSLRGQGRPDYEALVAAGRSDAEIILSATKSNEFVNGLPRGMKITGGILTVASVAFSVYLVVSADPADREKVIKEEAGGFAGGLLGSEIGTAVCVAAGIASGGFALVACGLIGGVAGGMVGRNPYGFLQMLDIAPHESEQAKGTMYRLQGSIEEVDLLIISIPTKTATENDHAVVIATGMISGELISGRGHYRKYQVIPANTAAERILQTKEPIYVPNYALVPYSPEDLQHD